MGLRKIFQEGKRLIMVGGKGGVGKSTCAAAIALKGVEEGRKTLILSSDPTPSLSDIFEVEVGDRIQEVVPGLYALEISPPVVLKRWKERFGGEIYEVISYFADLDYDFVLDYIGSAPGIEEEYMLYFILELVRGGDYDLVVWDTAPAGHTLRLLHLPDLFLKHLEGATRFYLNLYSSLERIKEGLRGGRGRRPLLDIIAGWRELSEEIAHFIRDHRQTEYLLVTIPEALGVRQTERILKDFKENGLRVRYLIVNNLVQEADCPFHQARQGMQRRYMSYLKERYKGELEIVTLPLLPLEVKGLKRIKEVTSLLFPPTRTPS